MKEWFVSGEWIVLDQVGLGSSQYVHNLWNLFDASVAIAAGIDFFCIYILKFSGNNQARGGHVTTYVRGVH